MRAELADGRILEFPDGTDPSVIQATVKKVLGVSQPQQESPALPSQTIGELPTDIRVGGEEALGTIASSIVAEPVAGIIGAVAAPFVGSEAAESMIKDIQDKLTFIPRTPEGINQIQKIGELLAPVGEAIQSAEQGAGDIAFEATGSPVAGAIGTTVPTVALTALGAGGVRRAAQVTKALKTAIPAKTQQVLDVGDVLTSDVIPPKTFVGKAVQKVTERIPVLGTGRKRAAQQKSRVESLDNIAREFDIDPSSSFEAKIVKSANEVFRKSQKRAGELRTQAVTELNKIGEVTPANAIKTIDDEIARITALGERGDTSLIETLQGIKGELSGNFERIKDIRTTIFDDIKDIGVGKSPIKSGGDATLTKVAGSLSKDLDDFAVNAGKLEGSTKELRQAANKWKASNRIFKDNFAKAKDTELRRALSKGNIQPEVVNTTIRGGKQSELKRLHGNLDIKGRQAVKQQILKTALEKANGNPTIFLNELNRVNNRRAIDIFFKGRDKVELDGLKKFLDITRRAQTEAASIASQAEVSALGLIGGAALAPKPVVGGAITIGLLGRAFESKAVRNSLLKLANMNPASKKAKQLAASIGVILAEGAQSTKQEDN